MLRRLKTVCAVPVLAGGLFAISPAASAVAAAAVSSTTTGHSTAPFTMQACTGDLVSGTIMRDFAVHLTVQGDQFWFTYTEADTGFLTDPLTGETYQGHGTSWFNNNGNQQNANFTGTFSLHLIGSLGDRLTIHEVAHLTVTALAAGAQVSVTFDMAGGGCSTS